MNHALSVVSKSCVAVIAVASAVVAAPAVHADPVDEPCALAMSPLCRFVPMAPELEGDVDYSRQQAGTGLLAPESAQPVDPCVNGCI